MTALHRLVIAASLCAVAFAAFCAGTSSDPPPALPTAATPLPPLESIPWQTRVSILSNATDHVAIIPRNSSNSTLAKRTKQRARQADRLIRIIDAMGTHHREVCEARGWGIAYICPRVTPAADAAAAPPIRVWADDGVVVRAAEVWRERWFHTASECVNVTEADVGAEGYGALTGRVAVFKTWLRRYVVRCVDDAETFAKKEVPQEPPGTEGG